MDEDDFRAIVEPLGRTPRAAHHPLRPVATSREPRPLRPPTPPTGPADRCPTDRRPRSRRRIDRAAGGRRRHRGPRPAARDPGHRAASWRPTAPIALDLKITDAALGRDARRLPRVRPVPGRAQGHDLRLGPHPARRPRSTQQAREMAPRAGRRTAGWSSPAPARGSWRPGWRAPGRDKSFGVNIRLPFEQRGQRVIARRPKLVSMKYFFTRKLMLMKESQGFVRCPAASAPSTRPSSC